jgi:hypothetical protein
MDIEGAELLALHGAEKILAAGKTVWFIAMHGEQACADCPALLQSRGYSIEGDGALWATPSAALCWDNDHIV